MKSLNEFTPEIAASITCVFADIDDTLTTDGRLPSDAYAALEALYNAGLYVVPITGRPAGWCDMIARFWPVHGVVGENGAFYFAYDEKEKIMRRSFFADAETRETNRAKLEALGKKILNEVPGCAISSDQLYREADLAIDFCEDVPALDDKAIEKIKTLFEEDGAIAKISSIHVNGWYGNYDKLSMTKQFTKDILGFELESNKEKIVFVGDSPNDAPMFGYFPNACGVANVQDLAHQMTALPAYIADEKGGAGFVQIAHKILKQR